MEEEFGFVTGTVAYRERIALPGDAIISVRIEEIGRGTAKLITEVNFTSGGQQVPLSFSVPYKKARISDGARYQLRASLLIGGKPRFSTTEPVAVFNGSATENIALILRGGVPGRALPTTVAAPLAKTVWRLTQLNGGAVVPASGNRFVQIVLDDTKTKVSGSGGVNRMFGGVKINGDRIAFDQIGGTMMAGPEPLMRQETAFFAALKDATRFKISGRQLELFAGAKPVAKFVAEGR